MGIVDRVKNIIVTPNTEWPVIAMEPATTGGLISGYAAPLIAIGAIASFIGVSIVVGMFSGGLGIFAGLTSAVFSFVAQLIGVFLLSFIINALATSFGGQKNSTQALKLAVYSLTPAWVAGVLRIVPVLGVLAILASLYGIYLMYLGIPSLMKTAQDKAAVYTAAIIGVCVAIGIVLSIVFAVTIGLGMMGAGMLGGALSSNSSPANDVQYDKDSPLGKLQELGKAMEKSNKEMEAAQKSGDPGAAAAAAMNSLGTLFGGGKKIDPLEIDQLKAFIPDTFAGLAKEGTGRAEKNGMGGFMISKAEANYGADSLKKVNLEITDAGAASGLMGFASWAAVGSVKEDENGSERTTKVGGRMVHERRSKSGSDEYSVMIADRFMVTAKSSDMNVDALKAAVSSLNLSGLEALKDVGVQKPQ